MRFAARLVLLVFLAAVSAAQQPRQDRSGNPVPVPLSEEPSHHMLLENERARVWSLEVPPQKTTLLHQHDNDFVYIVLTDGEVLSSMDGRSLAIAHQASNGDVRFLYGRHSHQLRNGEGFATYRDITVEIRKASHQPYVYPVTAATYFDYDALPVAVESGKSHTRVLDRDTVRISGVQILPGESRQVEMAGGPMLVVALDDLELMPAGASEAARLQKGEVVWEPPGFRKAMRNLGTAPARFVVLELK